MSGRGGGVRRRLTAAMASRAARSWRAPTKLALDAVVVFSAARQNGRRLRAQRPPLIRLVFGELRGPRQRLWPLLSACAKSTRPKK